MFQKLKKFEDEVDFLIALFDRVKFIVSMGNLFFFLNYLSDIE